MLLRNLKERDGNEMEDEWREREGWPFVNPAASSFLPFFLPFFLVSYLSE